MGSETAVRNIGIFLYRKNGLSGFGFFSCFNPSHSTEKGGIFSTLGFLGEKENSLKTDDYGRDLSSVQTLLTKQVCRGPFIG